MLLKQVRDNYEFHLVGSGASVNDLKKELKKNGIKNVKLHKPIGRENLVEFYEQMDVLFLQLNDREAFKRVIPSKLFEYAAFDKPIVGGLFGYSENFASKNIDGLYIYKPGDWQTLFKILNSLEVKKFHREDFRAKYSRKKINRFHYFIFGY